MLIDQSDAIIADLPPHRVAARVLQDALIQMVGDCDNDDDCDDAKNDGVDKTQPCASCASPPLPPYPLLT